MHILKEEEFKEINSWNCYHILCFNTSNKFAVRPLPFLIAGDLFQHLTID